MTPPVRPLGRVVLLLAATLAAGCASPAPPVEPDGPPPPGIETPAPPPAAPTPPRPFDPASVSAEVKTAALEDVSTLILDLNGIIQKKDFEAWLLRLTEEYKATYSDPANLARLSDSAVLRRLGIKLTSLKDYFLYVVYPSRQNDRVDDVEFVDERHLKAYTVSPKGERQVLYNLEKIDDTWKIGIGR